MKFPKVPSPLITGALVGFIVVGSGVGIWRAVRAFSPGPTIASAPRVNVSYAPAMTGSKTVAITLNTQGGSVSSRMTMPLSPSTSAHTITRKAPLYWDGATFYVQADDKNHGSKSRLWQPRKSCFKNQSATFDFTRRVEVQHASGYSLSSGSGTITVQQGVPATF